MKVSQKRQGIIGSPDMWIQCVGGTIYPLNLVSFQPIPSNWHHRPFDAASQKSESSCCLISHQSPSRLQDPAECSIRQLSTHPHFHVAPSLWWATVISCLDYCTGLSEESSQVLSCSHSCCPLRRPGYSFKTKSDFVIFLLGSTRWLRRIKAGGILEEAVSP